MMEHKIKVAYRRPGQLTRTIEGIGPNVIYVGPSEDVTGAKAVAIELGRSDIRFVGPSFVEGRRFKGLDNLLYLAHETFHHLSKAALDDVYAHNTTILHRRRLKDPED